MRAPDKGSPDTLGGVPGKMGDFGITEQLEDRPSPAETQGGNRLPVLAVVGGEVVDRDAAQIGELYERARSSLVDSVRYQIECGKLLAEKKASMAHGQWLPWLQNNAGLLGFESDRTAQRLIRLASANPTLTTDLDEAQAIQISRQTWGNSEGCHPITLSSGNPQWFTPLEVLDAVRATFGGGIDLDPASCAAAQERVAAREYFDAESNGLEQDWHGRAFLNPPYNAPLMRAFVEKLVAEVASGRVEEAVLLGNDQTDAAWFQQAAKAAQVFCFPYRRLNFYSPDRNDSSSHLCNSCLFYFGGRPQAFQEAFRDIGYFVRVLEGGRP